MLPVIMSHTPAGSSCSQMLHYGQEISDGKSEKVKKVNLYEEYLKYILMRILPLFFCNKCQK